MPTFADLYNIRLSTAKMNDVGDALDAVRTEHNGGTSAGSANAYTVTIAPALTANTLVSGVLFGFVPNFTNTGSATINPNALGAKTVKYMGNNLVGGELVNGRRAMVQYDGTDFVLMNHGGSYSTYTPTISSTMALSATSSDYARYQRHGDLVYFETLIRATLSGTASNSISITLPVTAVLSQYVTGFFFQPAPTQGCAYGELGTTLCAIKKYDGSNYDVGGAASAFVINGWYYVA